MENTTPQRKVNHSSFGARFVTEKLPGLAGEMLAYCIAGHHAGLPDAISVDACLVVSKLQSDLNMVFLLASLHSSKNGCSAL